MKTTISCNDFVAAFTKMGRENNFSHEGKKALFVHLKEYEDSTGEEIELDVIALCCEYTEYKDVDEFILSYGDSYAPDKLTTPDIADFDTQEDLREKTLEKLQEYTQVIDVDGTAFIIQDY